MDNLKTRDQKLITSWLLIGTIMVFVQILLGGITRLTGSGLSITRWEIVMGAIPPLNEVEWNAAFNLYKETPQYKHINRGIELSEFKFIYFWEFTHRLWARTMGFVFIIPFLFFLFRRSLKKVVLWRLGLVILFASLAAVFGWIMVASGLIQRPWVNAYKLTIHLILGILLFMTMFFTWISQKGYARVSENKNLRNNLFWLLALVSLQIVFGGFVSGMKSALFYPTWPLMNGKWIPDVILNRSNWKLGSFLLYDQSGFMPALAQFIHRNLALLIAIITVIFSIKWFRIHGDKWRWITFTLLGIVVVQVSLGVLTLLGSIGSIPVLSGSMHQGVGILFITFIFYIYLITKQINNT